MDLADYNLIKERRILGVLSKRWEKKDGTGLPVEEGIIDQTSVIQGSLYIALILAVLAPAYLINSVWFPLLLPFVGRDAEGKPCGKWLLAGMEEGEKGFGNRKYIQVLTNLLAPESRKSFALVNAGMFLVGSLFVAGILQSAGYKGFIGSNAAVIQPSGVLVASK